MIKIATRTTQETQRYAEEFSQGIQPGDILCLYGDLGAGKTTFVQGLAKGLGLTQRIISPTFVIMRTYTLPEQRMFYHVDLYRLEKEVDIQTIGLEELLEKREGIIAIEWPEKLGTLLPRKRIDIKLLHDGDGREVQIERKNL